MAEVNNSVGLNNRVLINPNNTQPTRENQQTNSEDKNKIQNQNDPDKNFDKAKASGVTKDLVENQILRQRDPVIEPPSQDLRNFNPQLDDQSRIETFNRQQQGAVEQGLQPRIGQQASIDISNNAIDEIKRTQGGKSLEPSLTPPPQGLENNSEDISSAENPGNLKESETQLDVKVEQKANVLDPLGQRSRVDELKPQRDEINKNNLNNGGVTRDEENPGQTTPKSQESTQTQRGQNIDKLI